MRLSYGLMAIAALTVTTVPARADWNWITGQSGFDTGRWCANMTAGVNYVQRDCTFNSIEQCRQVILSGNRGFCSLNPAYRPQPAPRYKKRRIVQ
jgi:hypothetical protein